jgi:cytochrome b
MPLAPLLVCRYAMQPVRRQTTQTNVTIMLYWGGAKLSAARLRRWQSWIEESLALLKESFRPLQNQAEF